VGELPRCSWAATDARLRAYHDEEWGQPVRCPKRLFEVLSLCTQQAGVSWRLVWAKREAYRAAFHGLELEHVAAMGDDDVERILVDPGHGVIKNRRKLCAIVANAKVLREVDRSHPGGLSAFLWGFCPAGEPIVNDELLTHDKAHLRANESNLSRSLATRLKGELGLHFLGSITLHAFAQQCGLINDHCRTCFLNPRSRA
jgi:DNA-3-methyladenine glycosylase I